jgi:hypothetical protein
MAVTFPVSLPIYYYYKKKDEEIYDNVHYINPPYYYDYDQGANPLNYHYHSDTFSPPTPISYPFEEDNF